VADLVERGLGLLDVLVMLGEVADELVERPPPRPPAWPDGR